MLKSHNNTLQYTISFKNTKTGHARRYVHSLARQSTLEDSILRRITEEYRRSRRNTKTQRPEKNLPTRITMPQIMPLNYFQQVNREPSAWAHDLVYRQTQQGEPLRRKNWMPIQPDEGQEIFKARAAKFDYSGTDRYPYKTLGRRMSRFSL